MLVERAGVWEDMIEVETGGIVKVTNGRKSGRQNAKKSQSGALHAVFYFILPDHIEPSLLMIKIVDAHMHRTKRDWVRVGEERRLAKRRSAPLAVVDEVRGKFRDLWVRFVLEPGRMDSKTRVGCALLNPILGKVADPKPFYVGPLEHIFSNTCNGDVPCRFGCNLWGHLWPFLCTFTRTHLVGL